jgi:hypothetical protein
MSVQVLSKFSVPCNGRTLHAIVPTYPADAIRWLQRDDPIWNKGSSLNWEWRLLPEQCRLRVRDRIKFWSA